MNCLLSKIIFSSSVTLLSIFFLTGCGSKTEKACKVHENLMEDMKDSLQKTECKIKETIQQVYELKQSVDSLEKEFLYHDNPRLVEGYYVLRGAPQEDYSDNTSFYARLNKSKKFELIANYNGKAFNQISINFGDESISSTPLPNDQALNYRIGNLSRLAICGEKADSIGNLIFKNSNRNATLKFLDSGRSVGQTTLTSQQLKPIVQTYEYYSTLIELKKAQLRIPLLSKKAEMFALETQRQQQKIDSLKNKN